MLDHFAFHVRWLGSVVARGAAEEGAQGRSVIDEHILLRVGGLHHLVVVVLAVAVDVGRGELGAAALRHRRGTALVQHPRLLVAFAGAADRLVVADHQRSKDDDPDDEDQNDH